MGQVIPLLSKGPRLKALLHIDKTNVHLTSIMTVNAFWEVRFSASRVKSVFHA